MGKRVLVIGQGNYAQDAQGVIHYLVNPTPNGLEHVASQ